MAAPGQPIFVIVQADRLNMEAQISESLVPYLAEGQLAQIEVDAYSGETFFGVIKNLSPAADPRTRSYTLRVALDDPKNLKAGMMGKITLTTEAKEEVVKVSRSSIVSRNGKDYLFVVSEGKAEQVEVKLGLLTDKEAEIKQGISPGAQVVTRGADSLRSGTLVTVIEEGAN